MEQDVPARLAALRRRAGNLKPRELEAIAVAVGFKYEHTSGSHAIYSKSGYWANISIPLHDLKRRTALRVLSVIEASLQGGNDE